MCLPYHNARGGYKIFIRLKWWILSSADGIRSCFVLVDQALKMRGHISKSCV